MTVWRISDVAVSRVLNHAATDDPLGIGTDHVDRRRRAADLAEEALLGLDEATAVRVAASLDDMIARRRIGTRELGAPFIDVRTARVLAAEGVDPLAAAWITACTGILDVDGVHEKARIDGSVEAGSPSSDTRVWLGHPRDETRWHQAGRMRIPVMPDATRIAMIGRRLGDVVGHAALEDLRITAVRRHEHYMVAETDHAPRAATGAHLVATAPHGCR